MRGIDDEKLINKQDGIGNKTFVEKELGRIRKQRSNQLKELERLKAQIAASKANQDAQKQE